MTFRLFPLLKQFRVRLALFLLCVLPVNSHYLNGCNVMVEFLISLGCEKCIQHFPLCVLLSLNLFLVLSLKLWFLEPKCRPGKRQTGWDRALRDRIALEDNKPKDIKRRAPPLHCSCVTGVLGTHRHQEETPYRADHIIYLAVHPPLSFALNHCSGHALSCLNSHITRPLTLLTSIILLELFMRTMD